MLVPITQRHITWGSPSDPLACPLALALYDATGRKWAVQGKVAYYAAGQNDWRKVKLSPGTQMLFAQYDSKHEMEPCSLVYDEAAGTLEVAALPMVNNSNWR